MSRRRSGEALVFTVATALLLLHALDDAFWVRIAMETAHEQRIDWPGRGRLAPPAPVVFTDCRFPNEAEAILAVGGSVVRILRPGVDTGDTHPSETALDDFEETFTVHNDQGLDHLRAEALRIAATLT